MPRRVLDLSTLAWRFGRAPRQPWSSAPVDDRSRVDEWLPATVPGDVRADLMAAGRIPAVATPEGISAGAWVDDWDWWYRVAVEALALPSEAVVLQADGIDFYCAIWLDGRLIATHAGMFARQSVMLSPYVNEPGPHELAVRIWGGGVFGDLPLAPAQRALRLAARLVRADLDLVSRRLATPKAQFSFGWDFAPRLLSTGIWDDVRLITSRAVYIEDMWAYGEPLTGLDDPTPAHWHVVLRLHGWEPGPVQVEITLRPENFAEAGYHRLVRTIELCTDPGASLTSECEFGLDTAAARRWWPWDQGDPCLYRVTVRLSDNAGILDEISQTAAVRSVRRGPLPTQRRRSGSPESDLQADQRVQEGPWQFVINGRPVFLRGANWVPADVLPGRLRETDYARLLAQVRAAGVNFLRVWGGGLREKQAFWDICDRSGVLAWQEFPLACDFLAGYSRDPEYLALLSAEAWGMVEALRNHPSLIAWCGGNEINPERERWQLRQITEVLRQRDPTRPWIPSSPGEGDVHQWDVWHGSAPWTDLAVEQPPFMSEFGLQALPAAETLAEMFPLDPPASLADRRWSERKAQVERLCHYAGLSRNEPLATAVATSQRVQASALQIGLEAARLRRPSYGVERTDGVKALSGGVAFWQFNEPWPAVSWSVVDHAGRPKAAYHMLSRSYQPILLAAVFPWRVYAAGETFQAELWLVNDALDGWENCCAEAELDGQLVWGRDSLAVYPASVQQIGQFKCRLSASPATLALRLTEADKLLVGNRYDLAVPLPPKRPLSARLSRWLAGRLREL